MCNRQTRGETKLFGFIAAREWSVHHNNIRRWNTYYSLKGEDTSLDNAVCRRSSPVPNIGLYGSSRERTGDMATPIRNTWTKTAHMPCKDLNNNSRNDEYVHRGNDALNTVTALKYLGSKSGSSKGAGETSLDEMETSDECFMRYTGKVYTTVIEPTMLHAA